MQYNRIWYRGGSGRATFFSRPLLLPLLSFCQLFLHISIVYFFFASYHLEAFIPGPEIKGKFDTHIIETNSEIFKLLPQERMDRQNHVRLPPYFHHHHHQLIASLSSTLFALLLFNFSHIFEFLPFHPLIIPFYHRCFVCSAIFVSG